MMNLILIPKAEMNPELRRAFDELLSAPEHTLDRGPVNAWKSFERYVYGFVDSSSQAPVAVVEASGRPICAPGWWINSALRGRGLGNQVVDLLADYLKNDGVTGIGRIPIDTYAGDYHAESTKLAARLHRHFATQST